jgi:hypothetical protein
LVIDIAHLRTGFLVGMAMVTLLAAAGASASAATQSNPVSYNIARTLEGMKKTDGIYLVISIAPDDFTRERMTQLARQLNHDFADQQKVDVSIFDDETVAKNVVPAGSHYVDFKAAERGVYQLNRAKGVEYIEFSTRRGLPSNEVKVNLGRSRAKRARKTTSLLFTNSPTPLNMPVNATRHLPRFV